MRTCRICLHTFPPSDFTSSRIDAKCRNCAMVHHREYIDSWRQQNKERCLGYTQKYYRNNVNKCRAATARWYTKNKTRVKQYDHKRRARPGQREKNALHMRLYRVSHRKLFCNLQKKYRARHPETIHALNAKRRAVLKHAPQTQKIYRRVVYLRDAGKCHICGKKVACTAMSLDHLIPLFHGGAHTYENVALAHNRCNSRRGAGYLPAQLRLFG